MFFLLPSILLLKIHDSRKDDLFQRLTPNDLVNIRKSIKLTDDIILEISNFLKKGYTISFL